MELGLRGNVTQWGPKTMARRPQLAVAIKELIPLQPQELITRGTRAHTPLSCLAFVDVMRSPRQGGAENDGRLKRWLKKPTPV